MRVGSFSVFLLLKTLSCYHWFQVQSGKTKVAFFHYYYYYYNNIDLSQKEVKALKLQKAGT